MMDLLCRNLPVPAAGALHRLKPAVVLVLLAALLHTPQAVWGQGEVLPVVPLPKQVEYREGRFTTDPAQTALRLAAGDTTGLMLPIRELAATYALTTGREPRVGAAAEREIWLGLPGQDPHFEEAARAAGLWPDGRIGEEGYALLIEPARVLVAAHTTAGLYYGAQTLKQLLRAYRTEGALPAVKVVDWPDLRYRALMDDISRGPVPTMDYLKAQVRRIAEMKMNMMTHYVEHVVATERHGLFAPADGALSMAEWRELADYARRHHVQLVGSFQSFGHFEKILSHPAYAPLGESGQLLSPVLPESIELLRDIYTEMVPAFDAPFFNANSDETFDLGRGASRQRVDSLGKGVVYAEHIQRIHQVLQELGVRTMIWGDIALQHPEVLDLLPKDIIMGTWDYSPHESFDHLISPFKEAGFDVFVTPGVLNSDRIMPDFREAFANIRGFVADGVRHDVLGMILTVWDDGGSALFARDWYGVAYAADQSWHARRDDAGGAFDTRFTRGVYGDDSDAYTRAIARLVTLADLSPTDRMNEKVLWTQIIPEQGQVLHLSLEDWDVVLERATEAAEVLRQAHPLCYAEDLDAFHFTTDLYRHMARSRSAVLGAAEAYRRASLLQRDDPPAARALLVAALDSLGQTRRDIVALSNTYRTLWLRENRTYALDRVLDRYAEQAAGLENTEHRLYEALSDFDKGHFLPPPVEVRLAVEETQGHYFREWLMSGPLPNPSGHPGATEDYLASMGGERAAEPGVAVEWAYDGKTYRWHRAASPQHAVVDLAALYPQQNENVVAYAHAMIHAPTPRRVRATLGSADGIEVILNGERVHHNPVKRTLMLDEEAVWLDLREGRNHLLLKISQTDGEWGFSFRLPDHTIRSSKNRYYIVD